MSTPAETTPGPRAARYVNRISAALLVLTPQAAGVYSAAQGVWLLAALNLVAVAMAAHVVYTTWRRIKHHTGLAATTESVPHEPTEPGGQPMTPPRNIPPAPGGGL